MKILLIHQYFKTPEEGGSIRSYYLARGMVGLGHELSVITAYNQKGLRVRNIEGIDVHYLPVRYENRFGFGRRAFTFLYFVFLTLRYTRKFKAFDLAYVMSTPLTTGIIAQWLCKRYRVPYFFEVGDLWPKAPIEMGIVKNRLLQNLLFHLERTTYKKAKQVVVLSPAIALEVCKIVNPGKVCLITNMADTAFFRPSSRDYGDVKFHPRSPYRIIYLGAAGKANHLDYYLHAAKCCLERSLPVMFYMMAEGSELGKMVALASAQQLTNLQFLHYQSKNAVRQELEKMDAIYISYKSIPVLQTGSPNKLFDGLAAGKQIIINFEGWIKDLIEENDCGFYVNPKQPQDLASKVSRFLHHPALIKKQQQNARILAESRYSREKQISRLGLALDAFEQKIR